MTFAFLAIDSDALKNIVFVAVALLAWGIKVAVERKEARQGGAARRTSAPKSDAPRQRIRARPEEVDVVFEKKPLPPTVRPKPRRRPAPRAPAMSEPQPMPGATAAREIGKIGKRRLKTPLREKLLDFDDESPPLARSGARIGSTTLSRLGVPPGRNARDMLRAGVLWSEVLGAPRSVTGPHRSPAAKRLRP